MNRLRKVLETLQDGKEYLISFLSGDTLGVKDFEPVDESIYNRTDLFVASIVSQVKCDKRFYRPGTAIQFSLNDVSAIIDKSSGEILYESKEKEKGSNLNI